jgi:hypothetical protein
MQIILIHHFDYGTGGQTLILEMRRLKPAMWWGCKSPAVKD